MQEDIGSLLRSLIREEIQNMTPAQPPAPGAGQDGPQGGREQGIAAGMLAGTPQVMPPGMPAGPMPMGPMPVAPLQGPAAGGTWPGTGAAPWGQPGYGPQALSPVQILAKAHMELTDSMRQNLQKLQAVLRETEILAQQMEQFLSYQSRQPWQQQDVRQGGGRPDGATPPGPGVQGAHGQAGSGGTGFAQDGQQGWEGQGSRRQGAARRRLWRGTS